MPDPVVVAVSVFLSVLLGLIVLRQVRAEWLAWLTRWDAVGFLPAFSFFAPVPGGLDYHLVWRDRLRDGSRTEWREAMLLDPRPLRSMVWNPEKRSRKAVVDLATALARQGESLGDETVQLSISYLVLLSFVTESAPHHSNAVCTQFAILVAEGDDVGSAAHLMSVSGEHAI